MNQKPYTVYRPEKDLYGIFLSIQYLFPLPPIFFHIFHLCCLSFANFTNKQIYSDIHQESRTLKSHSQISLAQMLRYIYHSFSTHYFLFLTVSKVYVYDSMINVNLTATIVSSNSTSITVRVPAVDYPRFISIQEYTRFPFPFPFPFSSSLLFQLSFYNQSLLTSFSSSSFVVVIMQASSRTADTKPSVDD